MSPEKLGMALGMLPEKSVMVRGAWSTALGRKRAVRRNSSYPMMSNNLADYLIITMHTIYIRALR
jgi:hypothetical protein